MAALDAGGAITRFMQQARHAGRCRPASPSQPPGQWKQHCGVLMNA